MYIDYSCTRFCSHLFSSSQKQCMSSTSILFLPLFSFFTLALDYNFITSCTMIIYLANIRFLLLFFWPH